MLKATKFAHLNFHAPGFKTSIPIISLLLHQRGFDHDNMKTALSSSYITVATWNMFLLCQYTGCLNLFNDSKSKLYCFLCSYITLKFNIKGEVHIFPVVIKRWQDLLKACSRSQEASNFEIIWYQYRICCNALETREIQPHEAWFEKSHIQYWLRLCYMTLW